MNDKLDSLLNQMREPEKEMTRELRRKETEFFYEVREKKVRFTEEALIRQRKLSKRLHRFLLDSPFLVLVTAPVIWFCVLPIAALDARTLDRAGKRQRCLRKGGEWDAKT